MGMVMSHDPV